MPGNSPRSGDIRQRNRGSTIRLIFPGQAVQMSEQHSHEPVLTAPRLGDRDAMVEYREIDIALVSSRDGTDQRTRSVITESAGLARDTPHLARSVQAPLQGAGVNAGHGKDVTQSMPGGRQLLIQGSHEFDRGTRTETIARIRAGAIAQCYLIPHRCRQ